jgi:tetratricopeptide (TPR) repeat protein
MIFAAAAPVVVQADLLHDQGKYAEARTLLLGAVSSAPEGKEKAELYWRAARETLELGDLAEKAKTPVADLLKIFEEGEGYANKGIEADPRNDLAYYWKSANIGRWGQVKGILNALFKASTMKEILTKVVALNPERSDAYFVLGQLYREVPGWPASFGNLEAAVSFGRKAVDLRRAQVQSGAEKDFTQNFAIELAKTLHKRNWTSTKRAGEQGKKTAKFSGAQTAYDMGFWYEGSVSLKDVSDRDEARELVQKAIADLGALSSLTASQAKDLEKAKDLLKGW